MAHEPPRPISPQLARLFGFGADSSETDGQLLERFQIRQDQEAFTALMRRHGPLVLGVCRRVLGDAHEAEDAFQATFLLLVRKIASIRKQASVASWLCRVAYHLALAAKTRANRRRLREQRVASREEVAMSDPGDHELWAVLDEELNRLPEKYHAPLVLCYLQGKTGDEAAHELGWPRGTVAGRLARARDLLRGRLSRRGVMLSVGLLPALPAHATAAVPLGLMHATGHNALHVAVSGAGSALPTEVAALMKEGMSLFRVNLKIAALVTAVLGVAGIGLLFAGGERNSAGAAGDGAVPAAILSAAEKKLDEQGKLKGTWQAIAITLPDGTSEIKEQIARTVLHFSEDKATLTVLMEARKYTCKLDPAQKPKHIDLVDDTDPKNPRTMLGIYELDDDTLKICIAGIGGSKRPDQFKTNERIQAGLLTLKRNQK